jgi:prepilin-type processing-associated H-X9-DG protein
VANGLGLTGGAFNPDPDTWLSTYSYAQSARGVNPFAPTSPPSYNLWGYPRLSRARDAGSKVLMTDIGGNFNDLGRPFPNNYTLFTIVTYANDGTTVQRGDYMNPHNKLSNALYFDGHVESVDPKTFMPRNFQHDQ